MLTLRKTCTTLKPITYLFMTAMLIASLVSWQNPLQAEADEVSIGTQGIQTGTSNTCTWTFDDSTKVLTIEPTMGSAGALASSYNDAANWPWNSFAASIETVEFIGNISTSTSATGLFADMSNLTNIVNLRQLNTSTATQMGSLFNGCTSLTSVDISNFATSMVTDMSYMFAGCLSLEAITFPAAFNTVKVTNMNGMLYGCSSLTSLDLSVFSTTTNTGMTYMFTGCTKLTQVTLGASFAFRSTDTGFPAPSGINAEGKPYTGKWKSVKYGYAYAANAMPSNVADTYIAETFDTRMDISGALIQGEILVASLSNPGGLTWSYQWARGDSESGPFTAISGAVGPSYTSTIDDAGKYLHCTASANGMSVSAAVGPIQGLTPDTPSLNAASLQSNGTVTLSYTTAATTSKPYTHIMVEYMLGDLGNWENYGEIAAASSSIETKVVDVDLSSAFEAEGVPSMISFRIKAKNASGESAWSNIADTSPQISVKVPTEMYGLVSSAGDITAPAQVIQNTGNLNIKIVNITMTKNQASYPTSTWECYQQGDLVNPLWQGNSSTSGPVTTSPLLAPGSSLNLMWQGTMTNTEGINLSTTPIPYGSIGYTVGFARI